MASQSTPRFSQYLHQASTSESTLPGISGDKAAIIPEDDPLWIDYTEKAASFDKRIIDDWNKIVDASLIFDGLFISVLATFVVDSYKQFKPDPGDISNQLLVGIYNLQLVALGLSDNSSIAVIDTDALFKLNSSDYQQAFICNGLLYSSLGLCCVASMFALAAKLWLISYEHRCTSFGTPRERAMKRQTAYNGVVAWKMGAVIQSLPLILLVAVVMFEFFVHTSIWSIQKVIGYAVGTLLATSVIALGITSLGAAFIPECPFRTPFSYIVQFAHDKFKGLPWEVQCGKHQVAVRVGILIFLWFVSGSVVAWATLQYSSSYISLLCIPITITLAFAMEWKATHTAQKYKLPILSLITFIIVGSAQAAAGYFRNPQEKLVFIGLYVIGMLVLLFFGFMARRLSKSMSDTAEIDAMTWLLTSTSTPSPELFKAVTSRILDSPAGVKYQPRFMNSLIPFLSPLIVSYHIDAQLQDLEIYVRCLADLSKFDNEGGSWWVLREDAKLHPKLGPELIKRLMEFNETTHQSTALRTSAELVLDNYNYKLSGRPKKLPTSESYTWQRFGESASMMTSEPAQVHVYEEMELHSGFGRKTNAVG